jgi:hypothetical protein
MRLFRIALFVGLLAGAAGCNSGDAETEEPTEAIAEGEEAGAAEEGGEEAAGDEGEEAVADPGTEDGEVAADTFENGVYTAPRFNVRFNLPEGWERAGVGDTGPAGIGTSNDSISFIGPGDAGLRLIVANSESIQLVDSSFGNITETIGFENVRIVPDASQTRTFNGIPGYRTEADAHLRGEPLPQYIIAQALDLPNRPTMLTVFVVGDQYDLHSDEMKAILDSVEALNLRPE